MPSFDCAQSKSRSATARDGVAKIFSRKLFVTQNSVYVSFRATEVPHTSGVLFFFYAICRAAENRTRSTCSRSTRTTGILRPDRENNFEEQSIPNHARLSTIVQPHYKSTNVPTGYYRYTTPHPSCFEDIL